MKKITDWQEATMTQETPLISIIVPVYQVKEYVGECIESLLTQTYTNLEILLVDDGSTDGSGEICDQYAGKDDRVRVVHQENQGLSAARNTGIELMKGEFAAFVDSDDVVLPDFIDTLYGLAEKYRADIAVCSYVKCSTENLATVKKNLSVDSRIGVCGNTDTRSGMSSKRAEKQKKLQEFCMTSKQMLRQWHGKYKKWETVVWNKLYRKSVFAMEDGKPCICFPIGRRHEDVLTSHLLIANAESVVITRKQLYFYRIRSGSITDLHILVKFKGENLCAQRERMAFFKGKRYWRAYLNLWVGYMLHWVWLEWMRVCKIFA